MAHGRRVTDNRVVKRIVHRSALVSHSAAEMYALVNDVASYPSFLPWCRGAEVIESSPTRMRARLELARGGLAKWFTTANALTPDRVIAIELEAGPFRTLHGRWTFEALGAAGSKITLDMEFEFDGFLLDLALGAQLEEIFASLLDAFVVRAAELHGG
jgi:ribosome-associated toxin RatA of RatAB toxin-antitoxin module